MIVVMVTVGDDGACVQVVVSFTTNVKVHGLDFKLRYESKRDLSTTFKIPGALWAEGSVCSLFDFKNWRPTVGHRSNPASEVRFGDVAIGGAVPTAFSTATFQHYVGRMNFSFGIVVTRLVRYGAFQRWVWRHVHRSRHFSTVWCTVAAVLG